MKSAKDPLSRSSYAVTDADTSPTRHRITAQSTPQVLWEITKSMIDDCPYSVDFNSKCSQCHVFLSKDSGSQEDRNRGNPKTCYLLLLKFSEAQLDHKIPRAIPGTFQVR